MTTCYIGLGSNLCQPAEQLQMAKNAIHALADCRLIKCSSIYQSKALTLDEQPQDDYLNAVFQVETCLEAENLLDKLQSIETQQGRTRNTRWGARTLDLDILLFGNQIIQTQRLTVPHAEMLNRDFVLIPLYQIAPDIEIPGEIPDEIPETGAAGSTPLKQLIKKHPGSSLKRIGEFNG